MSKQGNTILASIALATIGIGAFTVYNNNNAKYVDGVYRVECNDFDKQGWKPFMEMTFEGGLLTDVNFDYINKTNPDVLKTQDDAYNDRMLKKIGVNPRIYTKEFEVELIVEQSPDDIDGVAGASHSTREVQVMSKILFDKAKSGDTKTEIIPLID